MASALTSYMRDPEGYLIEIGLLKRAEPAAPGRQELV
jgi:hypothetical protein